MRTFRSKRLLLPEAARYLGAERYRRYGTVSLKTANSESATKRTADSHPTP
jgi:hypothetical protein